MLKKLGKIEITQGAVLLNLSNYLKLKSRVIFTWKLMYNNPIEPTLTSLRIMIIASYKSHWSKRNLGFIKFASRTIIYFMSHLYNLSIISSSMTNILFQFGC